METQHKFLITSCWNLLRARNNSGKSCRENQNTYFTFNNFFPRKSYRLWDNIGKCATAGQATDDDTTRRSRRFAHWITKATNTHSECHWIKKDQLDVTCFFISLFNAQHVSDVHTSILSSLRLICGGGVVSVCRLKQCFSLHTDTTPPQPNHSVTPTCIEPDQYNPWNNK